MINIRTTRRNAIFNEFSSLRCDRNKSNEKVISKKTEYRYLSGHNIF